ncbi:unnamed protein product [Chironomus riparius]|uniref:Hemolymph juvenile hormone binding protein n=1 Tax=Chironomus riparius TaxID=315576 RepID=A0A9N9WMQ4_9DIPT|nr:unnamed protein product [Chironomus riparius]
MKILIVISCLVAVSVGQFKDPPPFLKLCNIQDPKRDICIKNSLQEFLIDLPKNPNYFDFIQFEPFTYEPYTFKYDYGDFLKGYFKLFDGKGYGLKNTKVLKLKSDFTDKDMKILALVHMPKLFATANLDTKFELGSLKYENTIPFNATFRDVTTRWTIKGKIEERDGEQFMKIVLFDVLPEAKELVFGTSDVFPNEQLNDLFIGFINQNWKIFYNVMIGETRKQWEPVFRNVTNKFFEQIPFRKLVLSNDSF